MRIFGIDISYKIILGSVTVMVLVALGLFLITTDQIKFYERDDINLDNGNNEENEDLIGVVYRGSTQPYSSYRYEDVSCIENYCFGMHKGPDWDDGWVDISKVDITTTSLNSGNEIWGDGSRKRYRIANKNPSYGEPQKSVIGLDCESDGCNTIAFSRTLQKNDLNTWDYIEGTNTQDLHTEIDQISELQCNNLFCYVRGDIKVDDKKGITGNYKADRGEEDNNNIKDVPDICDDIMRSFSCIDNKCIASCQQTYGFGSEGLFLADMDKETKEKIFDVDEIGEPSEIYCDDSACYFLTYDDLNDGQDDERLEYIARIEITENVENIRDSYRETELFVSAQYDGDENEDVRLDCGADRCRFVMRSKNQNLIFFSIRKDSIGYSFTDDITFFCDENGIDCSPHDMAGYECFGNSCYMAYGKKIHKFEFDVKP